MNEGRGRSRTCHGLFLLLFLSCLTACSLSSPKSQSREQYLQRDLRSFHWALMSRDAPVALRYVPAEERDAWDDSFACLFEKLRLLEYRVELVKFREDSKEATVRVRWTGHWLDSLVVQEMLWKEEWSFDRKKQRWSLLPAPDVLKGLPEDCIPEVTERESSEEDETTDGQPR